MRYPPELVDQLAAEYTVGTLHGRARRRFEALMRLRADVRFAVWGWENILHGLTRGIEPAQPPSSVWRGICGRVVNEGQASPTAWRPRLRIAVVTVVVAAFAFWLGTVVPPDVSPVQPARVAIVSDDSAQALWVIRVDVENGMLMAESAGVPAATGNLVYELWALPAGFAPQSLGVLAEASGRYESALTPALVDAIRRSESLAISLEPPGGSPTGAPTGPVVYQASLVSL